MPLAGLTLPQPAQLALRGAQLAASDGELGGERLAGGTHPHEAIDHRAIADLTWVGSIVEERHHWRN